MHDPYGDTPRKTGRKPQVNASPVTDGPLASPVGYAADREEHPVGMALDRLVSSVIDVENEFSNLANSIMPALTPSMPQPQQNSDNKPCGPAADSGKSALVDSINGQSNRLMDLAASIRRVLERVEL